MTAIRKVSFPINAGILFVIASLATPHAEGVKTLVHGDGKANRVNLVFLPEGFTQKQQSIFVDYVEKTMDSFFLYQPWSNFKKLCNVYAIGVVSADSGCDFPADGVVKDTYFGASYSGSKLTGTSGYLSLVPMDADSNVTPFSKITTLLAEQVPDHDIVCIIVNEPYIPGAWAFQYSSPPYVLVPIAYGYGHSPVVLLHETAHIFAMLLDEYDIGFTTIGESKNTTAKTQRDQIRWNAWIAASTPIPTPETSEYFKVPGLFEGAVGCTTGWYRPKYECFMRTATDGGSFCEVCREEIIVNICKTVSLIDSFTPANSTAIKNPSGVSLVVRPARLDSFKIATRWSVNGSLLPIASDTLKLADAELKAGLNTIVVRAIDSSGMVRIPENRQFVKDSVTWTVENGPVGATTVALLPGEQFRVAQGSDGIIHVTYFLPRPQRVSIALWNMRGALLQTVCSGMQCAGTHEAILGDRRRGSGVYIVRFSSSDRLETATIQALSRF
jgi:hypothetical protein